MVGVVFWEIAYNFIKEKPLVGKEKERKKPTSKILLLWKVFKRFVKVNVSTWFLKVCFGS